MDTTTEITTNYPLYSFLIFTYNQEMFIRQALEGALSQTYPHLEIIISDDCSTDRTWEIIQEELKKYTGPHKLIPHRNEKNIGITGNFSKAVSLCNAEIIVSSGGDDISLPLRVQRTWEFFEKLGPQTKLLWCNISSIDENGNTLSVSKKRRALFKTLPKSLDDIGPRTLGPALGGGATLAFRKEIISFFGEIPSICFAEDNILIFRALLLGKANIIPEVLVHYRKHSGSTSNAGITNLAIEYKKRASGDLWFIQFFAQHLVDANYIIRKKPQLSEKIFKIEKMIYKQIKRQMLSYEIMSAFPHLRLATFFKTIFYPGFHRHFIYSLLYRAGFYRK